MEEIEKELEGNASPSSELLDEYALLHEHFLEAEGYSAETDLKVVLGRMGFTEDEFEKNTSSLSGGEKTRLALAKMLLEEPDLLILDEPTNHLDLQATEWLEGWIKAYHGAVLLVSHDLEEAVYLADHILLLTRRPTRVAENVRFTAPRLRDAGTLSTDYFIQTKARCLEIFQREVRK